MTKPTLKRHRAAIKAARATKSTPILLAIGVLNWPRAERAGDRYGLIVLDGSSGGYEGALSEDTVEQAKTLNTHGCEGKRGKLVAKIVATRTSGHIGDFFHGITPRTPQVGQRIILGSGTLFTEPVEGFRTATHGVGVKPDDNRDTLWLKLRALYDCHDQTVELWFEETR